MRKRFFSVNIQPLVQCGDRWYGMPVVRSRKGNSVEVCSCQEFSEIAISGAVFITIPIVYGVFRIAQVVLIYIAYSDHLNIALTEKGVHVAATHAAHADTTHNDTITGRRSSRSSKNGRWNKGRQCDASSDACGFPKKSATIQGFNYTHVFFLQLRTIAPTLTALLARKYSFSRSEYPALMHMTP
jgi:hypothetical protein